MPFYEEWIENSSTKNQLHVNNVGSVTDESGLSNVDLTRISTYRSAPMRNSKGRLIEQVEIPSGKADPYTTFQGVQEIRHDAKIAQGFSADLFQKDRGHPFELVNFKSEGTLFGGNFVRDVTGGFSTHQGLALDVFGDYDRSKFGFIEPGWTDLEAYAQNAYAKAAPDPAVFSLSNFLGELPMGLPKFGTALAHSSLLYKSQLFKAVGDDYLNLAFGWIPFLSDLTSAGTALAGATTALLGPRGPLHRSRREDPASSLSSNSLKDAFIRPTTWIDNSQPTVQQFHKKLGAGRGNVVLGNGNVSLYGDISHSTRIETERWFEGSYSFIPKVGFNPDSYFERLEVLMDPQITPSVLWELAPWSWLTDWFLKIGNSIAANEVASDNRIVSNYAYAMEKSVIERGAIFSKINATNSGKYAGPSAIVRRWTTTGKRRIRANPYGFKPMTTTNLNPNQWTILAALGLTRASR